MPKTHARLSPSSAARWINCPGSVRISEGLPPAGSSPYADEGTHAHMVAEIKLHKATGGISLRQYGKAMGNAAESEYWCAEMDEATDFYAAAVLEELLAAGEEASLCIEQRIDFSRWVPDGFGTSDAVIVSPDAITVIDLKYGKGVKVEAQGNPQLRIYALGAWSMFEGLYDLEKVKTMIIQPRLDHISTEELPVSELLQWADDVVAPRARMAANGTDYTACGDWCRWCPAKAVCRTRAEAQLELAAYDFRKPDLLTADDIADILGRAEDLQKWVADVQDYALQQALQGERYTGWKLVEGRAVRKYADELKVAETLKAAGIPEAALYERKLLGLTAMEKLVGKKKLTETLGELIVRPAGKPVLVPESDRRPEISAAESAKADFAD